MRSRTRIAVALVLCAVAPLLVGCSAPPDAETTRESLTEVTEDPTPPDAAEELDIDVEPEPIVEPLACSDLLVMTARGTGEPTRKQLLGPVTRSIAEARPGATTVIDLDYPADTDVKEGGTVGVRTLIDTLNVQAESCPEQQFVLLGYSQGALIIGDALASPDARLVGATVGELAADAADRVLAVVLYGNPRFVGSEPYDAGTYDPSMNGLLPRPPGSLDAFADRIRDYCVKRDFVCQSSLDLDESGHIAYYDNGMQQDGAAFVITALPPLRDENGDDASDTDPSEASTQTGETTPTQAR